MVEKWRIVIGRPEVEETRGGTMEERNGKENVESDLKKNGGKE